MKKNKVGLTFNIPKKYQKSLQVIVNGIRSKKYALADLESELTDLKDSLWDTVAQAYPGLREDYHLRLDHKTFEVSVLKKKEDWEK